MQPYSRPSNCACDLITALAVDPILSEVFFKRWDWFNGTIETRDTSNLIVSAISNDTLIRCSIDTERLVVNSVEFFTTGDTVRQLYYAVFAWGMLDDTVPYLEEIKISGYSQFQRGGVDFFNIIVNGKDGAINNAPERLRGEPSSSISIRQYGRTVHFDLPYQSTEASLYDFSGKMIYHTSIPQRYGRAFFVWDGRIRNGQIAASGRYVVSWKREERRNTHLFGFKGK